MISDHQIQNMGMTYPGCLFSSLDAQLEIRYVFRESVPATNLVGAGKRHHLQYPRTSMPALCQL